MTTESPATASRMWRHSSWIFAAELLVVPTGLITAGVLTRRLGPEQYGIFTLAATIVAWLQWTVISMFSRAANRTISMAVDWQPVAAEVIRLHAHAGVLIGLLVLIGAGEVADAVRQPALAAPLRLMALDLPFVILAQGYRSILMGRGDQLYVSRLAAVRWIVRMCAVVAFVALGYSVLGAVSGLIVASVAELVVARLRVGVPMRASGPIAQRIRADLLTLAIPVSLGAISLRFFDRADLFLLSVMGGTTENLGLYGAAQNLTIVGSLLAWAVGPVVLSSVLRMRRAGQHVAAASVERQVMTLPYLLVPFAALASGAAPQLMGIVYGEMFTASAIPFAILAFACVAQLSIAFSTTLFVAVGRPWLVLGVSIPMLLILALAGIWLVPALGIVGASLSMLVASVGGAVVAQALVAHVVGAAAAWRSITIGGLLALAAYAAARALPSTNMLGALTQLALLAGGIGVVLRVGGELAWSPWRFGREPQPAVDTPSAT